MKTIRHEFFHSINTFACSDNEVHIMTVDNQGNEIGITFVAQEILEWIDMGYVREKVIEYYLEINKEEAENLQKSTQNLINILKNGN